VSFYGGTTAETEVAPTQSPAHSAVAAGLPWNAAFAIVWPLALVASVYMAVGRLGFYPTDEGLIQAWSFRILNGQVPHRDFVSPVPEGSGLVHLIDFAIPGPLFEVSRFVALVEYAGYAVLFAWLVYGIAPWRWSILAALGAAGSVLVNLNTFPLIAWYTVDGLLLIAGGYLAVARGAQRRSAGMVAFGFLLLGTAAVMKQSFVPATAFGWLLLVPWLRELPWVVRIRALILTGLIGAVPAAAFVTVISLLGGFQALRSQLLGTAFVYGRPLVAAWSPKHDLVALGPLVAAAVLLLIAIEITSRGADRRNRTPSLLLRLAMSAFVVAITLWARLGLSGNEWGIRVFWVLVATLAVRSIFSRSVDLVGVVVLGAAWMSALSYGYGWPNLVAGTMTLLVLHRTWSEVKAPSVAPGRVRFAPAVAGLLTLVVLAYIFVAARQQDVYVDRPAAQLSASMGNVSSAFGDIRTNPLTAKYLVQMEQCIKRYPADRVAVLPENAAIYPALSLRNPFPIDWMWPDSMHGSEARILATADRLNNEGDYLVLFQTIGEPELVSGSSLPDARIDSPIHTYSPIVPQIYSRLNGQRATCGTFLVVYSPGSQ